MGSEPLFQEKLRHLYYFWSMTFSSFIVMLNIYLLLNYNPSLNSYFNFLVIVNKGNSKSYSCLALFSRNHIKVSIISVLKIKKYILVTIWEPGREEGVSVFRVSQSNDATVPGS